MTFKDYRDIIRQMERDMQQLTDEAFRGFFDLPVAGGRFWTPPIDIHETTENVVVKVEIAGVRAEDLHVSLAPDDKILTIGGMRKEQNEERCGRVRCHQLEIYFGPFERSVILPQGIPIDRERLTAGYRVGFLTVTLPKLCESTLLSTHAIPIINEAEERIEE